jgi:hypothetical protein
MVFEFGRYVVDVDVEKTKAFDDSELSFSAVFQIPKGE